MGDFRAKQFANPFRAGRRECGQEQGRFRVPAEQLRVGQRIRVRPGENFAVDGVVISGEGSVNEASITGEANPAYKGPGHTVYAGTTNLDGSFVIEATQVGTAPPTFLLFANRRLPRGHAYRRYLANTVRREIGGLPGVPIRLTVRRR